MTNWLYIKANFIDLSDLVRYKCIKRGSMKQKKKKLNLEPSEILHPKYIYAFSIFRGLIKMTQFRNVKNLW